MNFLAIILLLVNQICSQIQIQYLNSSGIIFESIANSVTYQKKWTIYTQVNLYQEDETLAFLTAVDGKIKDLCTMAGDKTNASCSYWHEEIKKTTTKIQSQIDAVNYFNINRRQKRAWFNIIGTGMKTLFGTMSQDDADDISSKIKALEEHDKENLHIIQKHITVVQSAFNNLNKAFTNMTIQMNRFEERFERFSNKLVTEIRSLKKEFQILHIHTEMNELLIFTLHLLQQIYSHLNEQYSILSSLQQRKLHPSILTAETLTKLQSEIANQTDVLHLDFPSFTQIIRVDAEHLGNGILVRITFPMPSRDIYTLNKVYLFPKPTNKTNFAILDTKTDYILNNTKKGVSIELTTDEFRSSCQEILLNHFIPMYICKITQPRQISPFNSKCLPNLLVKNPFPTTDCTYRILKQTSDTLTKLVSRNSWLFSFQKTRILAIKCTDENSHDSLIGNGILTLTSDCTYILDKQELPFEGNIEFNLPIHQPDQHNIPIFILDRKTDLTPKNEQIEDINFKTHHSLNINLQESSKSLQEFNDEIQKIQTDRKNENHKTVTYINSSITIVLSTSLITIIIVYLRKRKISKRTHKTTVASLNAIHIPINLNENTCNNEEIGNTITPPSHTVLIHPSRSPPRKMREGPPPPPMPLAKPKQIGKVKQICETLNEKQRVRKSLESLN